MNYIPAIKSATPVAEFEIAGHTALLFDEIVSAGSIQYLYILAVYTPNDEPCLFIASEVNGMQQRFGGGSHFLGLFPGDGHLNLGDSDEWADRDQFVAKALKLAEEQLTSSS